jgi:hypothetical protein
VGETLPPARMRMMMWWSGARFLRQFVPRLLTRWLDAARR